MKKIAVIGCTGSIGTQTLDIVRSDRSEYSIAALSCGSNADALISYAKEFGCKTLGIADEQKRAAVKAAMPDADIYCGDGALVDIARSDADIVVVAVVGMVGLKAVLAALECKKIVALANKESLVAGGELVMRALKNGGELRPVDSEHSAVWQCLRGENTNKIKRVILTASGGPFFFERGTLDDVTPERAVAHPNWRMGRKISVDSATMMNKGLEIIEARWLFDTFDIDYVIHPESVVHSMIEFADGSIKAQASHADMRLPIRYALGYPKHRACEYTELTLPLNLRFLPPDETRFPAPRLAREAMKCGGTMPTILNAANEAADALFLDGKIKFTDIIRLVEKTLGEETAEKITTADALFDTHKRIYDKIYFNV